MSSFSSNSSTSQEFANKRRKNETNQKSSELLPVIDPLEGELSDGQAGDFKMTSDEYEEERIHVFKVMTALRYYPNYMSMVISRVDRNILKLKPEHRQMVPDYPGRIHQFRDAIKTNTDFLNAILSACDQVFVNSNVANRSNLDQLQPPISDRTVSSSFTKMDIDKVDSLLPENYLDYRISPNKRRVNENGICMIKLIPINL